MPFAYAEDDSSVYTATFDDAVYQYTVSDAGDAALTAVLPSDGVTSLSLPESIDGHPLRSLQAGCFDQCSSLQKLLLPASVSSIADGALDGCTSLEAIDVSPDNMSLFTKDGALLQQKEERIGDSNLFISTLYLIFYPPEKKDSYYFLPYGVESAEKLQSKYLETLELTTENGFSGSISDFPNLKTLIIGGEDLQYYECYQNLDTLVVACKSGSPQYTAEEKLPQNLHVVSQADSIAQEWAQRDGAQFEALDASTLQLTEPAGYQDETAIKRSITKGDFDFTAESNGSVEYASTNERVAAIDENGKVCVSAGGVTLLYAYTRYDGQHLPSFMKYHLQISKDPFPTTAETVYVTPGCEPFYVQANKKYDDLELTYYTDEDATVLTVTPDGLVTLLADKPGLYSVYASNQETAKADASSVLIPIVISKIDQGITGPKTMRVVYGKKLKLKIKFKTPVKYRSSNKNIAKVSSKGVVTFLRPGTVTIHMTANPDDTYKGAVFATKIICKLGKPQLKVKAGKRKAKLSWNSVHAAQKYLIYCKAPSQKSFKRVTTKLASVKGITHNNLKKGKKYTYKIRVYAKIKGKKFYGPYSDPVTVKVR